MAEKNYITESGFKKLQQEYQKLFHEERPKLVETVAWAASNGDRSENADYIYGKRRLREIDSRLRFLTHRLESAVVVNPSQITTESIVFGSIVDLEDEEGETVQFQIVGEDETQPEIGKISWVSPIAKALLGKKLDDEVVVKRPAGDKVYIVLKISRENHDARSC